MTVPLTVSEIVAERWKNGAGVTRTLASAGTDADAASSFDWRVSIAEIEHSGPFSVFPGVDRIAVVLENGPLRLSASEGQGQIVAPRVLASQLAPTPYSGDTQLFADVAGAPIRCLNVMTRRGRASANVSLLNASGMLPAAADMVLYATPGGSWRLTRRATTGTGQAAAAAATSIHLGPDQSLTLSASDALEATRMAGDGHLIVIHLTWKAQAGT